MKLMIIGAGGHGKVAADCAHATGRFSDIVFLDGQYPDYKQANRWPVVGKPEQFQDFADDYQLFIAIGNNETRGVWHQKLTATGIEPATLIHPSAVIGMDVQIAAGTLVLANAVINTLTQVGRSCIVNTAASIDHDCDIGDFVHVAPGSRCAGDVQLESEVFLGIGSVVVQGCSIGKASVIGAGAAVINHIPSHVTAVGTPAKVIKSKG